MPLAPPLNLPRWLAEHADRLQPPVNNFCLYTGDDYVIMAVGGPNERSDYHVNQTEEWFYQYKGGMTLRIVDDGTTFRDVEIGEGEMFLLPRGTPHNPVRYANTVGIVVERKRPAESIDSLRWYCKSGRHSEPTIIREESFHASDLGTQLKPLIQRWQEGGEDIRRCQACGVVAPVV